MKKIISLGIVIVVSLFAFQSCRQGPPIRMAEKVNLDLFMGDWFVIANIPTFIEKGAHNAIETYEREDENVINTTFSFNKDSFTGPKKEYNPTGFVQDDPSNAEWKMQFLWPFKSEYIIVYVDPAYEYTIIGRTKRDYVWIMARKPQIDQRELERLIQIAVDEGYDRNAIQLVPQEANKKP
ncbi:lipocalin family protein [Marinicella sp. S1101]|uniref:lipocalin family protein n=1 Tax=Marinicella marina TaxID=2996016 RepID=UPI002260B7F2|nr:lipocalin family protein [Marinicella marina]MCX7555043.1 lipocalin family protein [Marinicella marina]MDJ1141351.1 lipocalin family protein [Marinicella marina]